MRALPLVLLAGCGPGAEVLVSGSYVTDDPSRHLGLEGVNLALDQEIALFVTPDAVIERTITLLGEPDWLTACPDASPHGIVEQTVAIDPEPVALPDGPVAFATLSASCEEQGGIRLVATDPPATEWILSAF
ncbi:MAG: hypothetical protein ABMA64_18665 [Myxococcota bacterium]